MVQRSLPHYGRQISESEPKAKGTAKGENQQCSSEEGKDGLSRQGGAEKEVEECRQSDNPVFEELGEKSLSRYRRSPRGYGSSTESRFRQVARWGMRTISQIRKATTPPGRVTSMNQPNTPAYTAAGHNLPADHAGMHRSFIYSAPVRIQASSANHSYLLLSSIHIPAKMKPVEFEYRRHLTGPVTFAPC